MGRQFYFLHALTDFDDLGGAGFGMSLNPSALGPLVGVIVTVHVANQKLSAVLCKITRMSRLARIDQKFGSLDLSTRWN